MKATNKPLMTVRPAFTPRLVMWRALPWVALGTLALTVAGGTIIWLLLTLAGVGQKMPPGLPYFLCLVMGLVTIAPLYYEAQRKISARTVCRFFERHLEYETYTLFFRRHEGRVHYRDISGMVTRADFLQHRFGLKTIYLSVPGMDWQERGFSGLKLADIPSGRGIGRRLQTLLDHEEVTTPAAKWVAPSGPRLDPQSPPAPLPRDESAGG